MKKKLALVLSGGGALGMAHLGVLKALEENKALRQIGLTDDEKKIIKSYSFLTLKPIIYLYRKYVTNVFNFTDIGSLRYLHISIT